MKKDSMLAGIDISSHDIRMKIAYVNKGGNIKTIESVRHAVRLGRDTFTSGKVSFQTLLDTCEVLKRYKTLLSEYKVRFYRATATGAVREAINREYIVDQIKIKTGLNIEVMGNAEKRFLTYGAISNVVQNFEDLKKDGLLIIDAGSASTQISCFQDGMLINTQNLKVGSVRIREILSGLESQTTEISSLLEEYIDCRIDTAEVVINGLKLSNLMIMGSGVRSIAALCSNSKTPEDVRQIQTHVFWECYDHLKNVSPKEISHLKKISPSEAEILLPSMTTFKRFLEISSANVIYTPQVNLADGLIVFLTEKYCKLKVQAPNDDILNAARQLAVKYRYNPEHSSFVERTSISLFNSLRKLHNLTERHRLLLQLAAILHDTGKFISINNHYLHSYEIIMSSELPGLSRDELEIVANVARYHSAKIPSEKDSNFTQMNHQGKLAAAKLIAMIRLADAMDKSHRQKIKNIKVETAKNEIIIKIEVTDKPLLEQWAFESKSEFFKEVFGVTPVIKIKKDLSI